MSLLKALLRFSAVCSVGLSVAFAADDGRPAAARYETRNQPSRDGIGKVYFGREISHVMGHQAANWLERPERETEERTDLLLEALALKPGEIVADIGAGSGYFSWRMAQKVGEQGVVYAVDIQQQMLDILMSQMNRRKVGAIVKPVLGTVQDPKLPAAGVDTILLVDVYHEFDFPYEMTRAMVAALKRGGRLVLVEYRGEDPDVPIKPLHKMTVAQVQKEMSVHPIRLEKVLKVLPRQHIIVFRKD
ncbi:class I SAM-dependent methyltransferase [Horticoccus sp. 23ND18S-11]|uniref:class I SAM-dependent methyltransferase n=1 Tax=Horticoccus sp. 23ND18S-11 TaxID=3391832 RepID=UPI0039C9E7D4